MEAESRMAKPPSHQPERQALEDRVAALEQERDRLSTLLDRNPAVTYRAKASGAFAATYVSAGITAQLGYQPRDFTENPTFWADHLHPEDQSRVLAEMSQAVGSESGTFEYRFQHQDGTYRHMRDECHVDTTHEPPELIGYWTDITRLSEAEDILLSSSERLEVRITERAAELATANDELTAEVAEHERTERALRESEAKFRSFSEQSGAAIGTTDGKRFTYVNPRFAEITGFTRAELLRMTPSDLIIPESRRMIADRLAARMRGKPEPTEYETQILTKHGTRRWLDVSVTMLMTGDGAVSLCTLVDTTDRKAADATATMLRDQLAHVTRLGALGELATSLAHELNQPLSAILSNAQVGCRYLKQESLDRVEFTETLNDIVANARRAGAIIQRLRDLVRKRPSEHHPVDLRELVHEVVRLVADHVRLKAIDIRHDLGADLPRVVGDKVQLQQVVLNLLFNAIEAIDKTGDTNGGEIMIRVTRANGGVALDVTDNGVGFEAVNAARIFDPFVTTKAEGIGMGLSISSTIAQAHGGRLSATRNTGRGVTFRLSLPVGPAPAP